MKTSKEITINYLMSIMKDKQSMLDTGDFTKAQSVKLGLGMDIQTIDRVIGIVKESEDE